MSPSYRHRTPPRRCADSVLAFESPMYSPLRQPAAFSSPKFAIEDSQNIFHGTPYKSPAQAPLYNIHTYSTKPQPIPADDEEGLIFLSSSNNANPCFTPLFSSSSSPTLLTPVNHPRSSGRVVLSSRSINEPQSPTITAREFTRVGIGTKRKSTPQCTPLKIDTSGSLQRLAPLPAPRFTTHTPQTKAEAEAFVSKNTATLTKLKLSDRMDTSDDDSDCEFDRDGGIALFKSIHPGAKGKAREEVAEAVSPGGHITKRRAKARPLSAELLSQQVLRSPSPVKKTQFHKTRPRHSGPVVFPSATAYRSRASPGSSSSEAGSPVPRRHIPNGGARPYIKPPVFTSRPMMSRQDNLSAATLFFGPTIQQPTVFSPAPRSRTDSAIGGAATTSQLQRSSKSANRHSYAGTGSSGDWAHIPPAFVSPPAPSPSLSMDPGYPTTDDEDDMSFEGPGQSSFTFSTADFSPPPKATKMLPTKYELHRRNSTLSILPCASTSVSSLGSDDGLITPLTVGPLESGWPAPQVRVKDSDEQRLAFTDDETDIDELIQRTLAAGTKGSGPGGKRPPGTPVKKVRTAFLADRPWQSAVASKIGLKDDDHTKKVPRKSLPAAFPPMGSKAGRSLLDQCSDTEDEEDSPSAKKDGRYTKLGLGHPAALFGAFGANGSLANPRTRRLMRRSSSGAFSSSSESTTVNTPTRVKAIDWQVSKLTSPSGTASKLAPSERSASGSSTSSGATSSPTNRKGGSVHGLGETRRPKLSLVNRRMSAPLAEGQSGRFEREFVTVDEVGSGEFGSVIKVRSKSGDDSEVYAIKRSKRFEGVKHRQRLWEEVQVLKHLSEAAPRSGLNGRHPNVLAYIDSWEEDEALFIQTELCESGNLSRFLWEFGKQVPRLDEAKVWKSVVDLANGLNFIHESGVIHLDLKPSNVFVTQEGRFKIGDFGMASLWPREASAETDRTEGAPSFEREGDKLYLAPEVLQGRYSKAADIFSFGMTILETATNIVVPDQGDSWHRLRREDFSEVPWEGSNALLDLIKSMMRTDPAERLDARGIHNHPVVTRARERMEEMDARARAEGTTVFAATPLGGEPRGFLEEILGDDGAMDVSG